MLWQLRRIRENKTSGRPFSNKRWPVSAVGRRFSCHSIRTAKAWVVGAADGAGRTQRSPTRRTWAGRPAQCWDYVTSCPGGSAGSQTIEIPNPLCCQLTDAETWKLEQWCMISATIYFVVINASTETTFVSPLCMPSLCVKNGNITCGKIMLCCGTISVSTCRIWFEA